MGKGTKRVRGGRTFSDTSRRSDRHTVGMPLFSYDARDQSDGLVAHRSKTGTRNTALGLVAT